MKRIRSFLGIILFLGVVALIVFQVMMFISKDNSKTTIIENKGKESSSEQIKTKELNLVAIGDSLTEGIGDSTGRGGYVPLVAELLESKDEIETVSASNYGISGNRSDQILKRIKKDEKLQNDVKKADVIVLTVGGNDLMKVVRSTLLKVKEDSFIKPQKEYKERIEETFKELRSLNSDAPIYVFGIYNPFYLYFSEITEMQDIVDSWNETTQSVVEEEQKAHFIPINDILYKGGNQPELSEDQKDTIDSSVNDKKESKVFNDLLFEEDNFHPNDSGYELMAQSLFDEMMASRKEW
ncbi:lipase [Carnobacterium maltaromaticum]|uniref:SGNH/GDSL hydrolase family protein n=1 Tax=Carnobacterium maltaromaticum TaxID=2751 RepID=UPI000704D96C|nr:SGNH/GDSL hydrolase family protein [Carnobacterium maltaromaticum]KRN87731.1 putative Lipase Acylhydrolase [Carnobacterium maltaromaticum]MDT1944727.1 SGNH/GDSL hydrolase family protein [Carnobacterium maltaromaticum]MDT1998376.1 SGNH/GDSL hydrolase family protein [Carnobacterium maltaromaticum]TFJ28209.1 lipase [Carnobacterium maltaromaticum]TFJ31892.1 lipase [Carnobacterium maltaromaticum]